MVTVANTDERSNMTDLSEHERAVAKAIWTASRADEGTISATGANIIARTLLAPGGDVAGMVAAEVDVVAKGAADFAYDAGRELGHEEGAAEVRAGMEAALSNHPDACDRYDDTDVIKCGWKSAVLDVRAALAGEEV
jgi:hypothetical protein